MSGYVGVSTLPDEDCIGGAVLPCFFSTIRSDQTLLGRIVVVLKQRGSRNRAILIT